MTYKTNLTLTLDLGVLGERDVDFAVRYAPATRDVMYLPNGDPGYPGDPAELDILSALVGGVEITTLLLENDDLYNRLLVEADEWAREDSREGDEP
jgi:hypothetical protein